MSSIKLLSDLGLHCYDCFSRYTVRESLDFMLEASALDHRFKSLPYSTDDQRNEVFNRLVDRVHNINATKVIHCYLLKNIFGKPRECYNQLKPIQFTRERGTTCTKNKKKQQQMKQTSTHLALKHPLPTISKSK